MALIVPGQDTADLIAAVAKGEMAEHLRDAAKYAGAYIEAYAFQLVMNRAAEPRPSLLMHSSMRHLARELVRDEAARLRRL